MNDMYIAYSWLAVSTAAFAGWWLYLHYRRKDRTIAGQAEVERLEAQVQDLQAELGAVTSEFQDRLDQLHERVDFSERLLLDRPAAGSRPRKSETPTPV